MLEAEDIVFSYTKGQKPVLDHISLSVGPEERVGILGPSGYGKNHADEDTGRLSEA